MLLMGGEGLEGVYDRMEWGLGRVLITMWELEWKEFN